MPNWCKNFLHVSGPKRTLARFQTQATPAMTGGDLPATDPPEVFSFHRLVPVPPAPSSPSPKPRTSTPHGSAAGVVARRPGTRLVNPRPTAASSTCSSRPGRRPSRSCGKSVAAGPPWSSPWTTTSPCWRLPDTRALLTDVYNRLQNAPLSLEPCAPGRKPFFGNSGPDGTGERQKGAKRPRNSLKMPVPASPILVVLPLKPCLQNGDRNRAAGCQPWTDYDEPRLSMAGHTRAVNGRLRPFTKCPIAP